MTRKLSIGFVRRGYSPSGGAESYLKRLARGLVDLGHEAQLFTTDDWPPNEWPFGPLTQLGARHARGIFSHYLMFQLSYAAQPAWLAYGQPGRP